MKAIAAEGIYPRKWINHWSKAEVELRAAVIKVFSDEKIFVFIRFNISLSTGIRNLEFNMFKVSIISSGFILSKPWRDFVKLIISDTNTKIMEIVKVKIRRKNIIVEIKEADQLLSFNLVIKYFVGYFNRYAKIKANTNGKLNFNVLKKIIKPRLYNMKKIPSFSKRSKIKLTS